MNFFEKYKNITQKNNSYVCVGLDSEFKKLPKCVMTEKDPVLVFNKRIIDETKDFVAAYKPNFAFYLTQGAKGIETLKNTIDYIPEEIPVIVDIKAGDIGNTMEQYAKSFFEYFRCDAITVNPLMGRDVIDAVMNIENSFVFALALTSNPSAKDFFDHHNLSEEISKLICSYGPEKAGAVVGATQTSDLARMRSYMPDTVFLIPGIGAQGGDLAEVVRQARYVRRDPRFLINSSRGIIFAGDCQTSEFALKAQDALKDINQQIQTLLDV